MDERLYLEKTQIIRWNNGRWNDEEDWLSIEEPLALEVNGHRVAVLMRLPGAEKELAAGFLVSEGLVENFGAIKMISHCGRLLPGEVSEDPLQPSRNIVRVRASGLEDRTDTALLLIRSGCGRTRVSDLDETLPRVTGEVIVDMEVLTRIARVILEEQEVRKMAGGVHLAALFDRQGTLLCAYEDVGRHNAADKVVGHALLSGIGLEDKILYNTGRASYELVTKAARMNIPVLASKSSPTSLAVELAETTGITLCGFVRPHRANIYSGRHRVRLEEQTPPEE